MRLNEDRLYEQTKKKPALALGADIAVSAAPSVCSRGVFGLSKYRECCFEDTLKAQTSQEAFDAEMLE